MKVDAVCITPAGVQLCIADETYANVIYLLQGSIVGVKQAIYVQVSKGGATPGTDVGGTILYLV